MPIPTRFLAALAAAATLLGAAACGGSDSPTEPTQKPSSSLVIVKRTAAPPLVTNSISFYAKKGTDSEVRMQYVGSSSGGGGAEFLRFRVRANSLLSRPDGSAIATGDSVLITVTAVPGQVAVDFQPSGLRFSPAEPAELKLRFAEANSDYNGDGVVDAKDIAVRPQLAVWSQESAALPWTKLLTDLKLDIDEAEAKVLGFTTYAVAY